MDLLPSVEVLDANLDVIKAKAMALPESERGQFLLEIGLALAKRFINAHSSSDMERSVSVFEILHL